MLYERQTSVQPECQRQRRARTLSSHPPRAHQQASGRTLARSVGAPWRLCCKGKHKLQVLGPGGKHSTTRVPKAETSTHLQHFSTKSAPASGRTLARSVGAPWWLRCNGKLKMQVLGPDGKHSPTRVPKAETSTHFEPASTESAPASGRTLARSVGAPWRLRCKGKHVLQVLPGRSALGGQLQVLRGRRPRRRLGGCQQLFSAAGRHSSAIFIRLIYHYDPSTATDVHELFVKNLECGNKDNIVYYSSDHESAN